MTFGKLLVLIALGAGAWKSWSISRRPTTNLKCALGLMLLLGSCWLFTLAFAFVPQSKSFMAFVGLLALAAFGLLVGSFVVSIIGLVEYTQARGRYRQGLSQAISALVVCVLFGLGLCAAAVNKAMQTGLASQTQPGASLAFEDFNFRIKAPNRPWVQADAARINADARVAFIRARPELFLMVIAE